MTILAFIGAPGPVELCIVGVVALLLFGKRLPEVARSVGSSFVEFKRGLTSGQEALNDASSFLNEQAESVKDTVKKAK